MGNKVKKSHRKWFTGWLACILLFATVIQPEHTLKAADQTISISGNAQIVANGIYELTGTDSNLREIQIVDGVTDVVLRQQFSDVTLSATISTYNTQSLNLTIDSLQLNSLFNSTIDLRGSGEVRLILKGANSLDTSTYYALSAPPALAVEGNARLTISGEGSLVARSGSSAAGIGSRAFTPTGTIVINEGTIIATSEPTPGGTNGGAGIGGGYSSSPGVIIINGGTITATGSRGGAGIGGGSYGDSGTITINGGMIHATGSNGGAGIGGGGGGRGNTIIINGGEITANGGYLFYNGHWSGAGIGGGYSGDGGDIIISDGLIIASGGDGYSAGIGGGSSYFNEYLPYPATIQLLGGIVYSTPGHDGNMFSGVVNNNVEAPPLLTLTFIEHEGSQTPVANADISLRNSTVRTDQHGTIPLHVVAGAYTLDDFELSGANGYRPVSLTPSTIQVDNQQPNAGTILWSNRYALLWQLDGGTLEQSPVTEAVYGTSIAAPSPVPQRSGFTFDGWYTNTMQKVTFPFTLLSDTELFAHWTGNSLSLSGASLPSGTYGEAYSSSIPDATGGTGNYTFVVTDGALPDGLTLNGRAIEGVAEKAGNYVFEVTVTDTASGTTAVQQFTIDIQAAVPVSDDTVQAGRLRSGEPLRQAALSGSFRHPTTGEPVPGALNWADPTVVPSQSDTSQAWLFTPSDLRNYAEVGGTTQVSWASSSPLPGNNPDRVYSTNANLAELLVRAGDSMLALSPSFAPETTTYKARTEEARIDITWKTAHPAAHVRLENETVTEKSGHELEVGENLFVLTVQAENGARKTYRLNIQRDLPKQPESPDTPTGPLEPATEFSDIAGSWAEAAIKRAVRQGIVSGYPDHTFKPNKSVTRAEFTVLLARTLEWKHAGTELAFTDQEQIGVWATEAVAQAVQAGVLNGYEDGRFLPDAPITRAEMATMFARALGLQTPTNTTAFADDEAIPEWAKSAVEASRIQGILIGRGDNRFEPNSSANRAEATMIMLRMLD